MTNFTKEEISLCKQMAEKHRRTVEQGDWIQQNCVKPEIVLVTTAYIYEKLNFLHNEYWFPLWTISDCLEFLKMQEEMNFEALYRLHGNKTFEVELSSSCYIITHYRGKTPLEACLRAVLAVLEEKK